VGRMVAIRQTGMLDAEEEEEDVIVKANMGL
jgi:hypothetical protein